MDPNWSLATASKNGIKKGIPKENVWLSSMSMEHLSSFFSRFWERYPALSLGMMLLLASLFALASPLAALPAVLLFCTLDRKKKWIFLALFSFQVIHIQARYLFPLETQSGKGVFSIETKQPARRGGWIYRGTLLAFVPKEGMTPSAKNIPCRLFSKQQHALSTTYLLEGELKKGKGVAALFKPKGNWEVLQTHIALGAIREKAKSRVSDYLKKCLPSERACKFLVGLLTGELSDRTLINEFGALGLSHILAISGFHFALVALFFDLIFRPFFSPKKRALLLLNVLTLYFLFVGATPSVERSWMAIGIFFSSHLFERRSVGLNSLGVGLALICLFDPLASLNLGFQLSFLATAGIFLLYPPLEKGLGFLFPKRDFETVVRKNLVYQHLYVVRSFLKGALALAFGVHLMLMPLLLYHFHSIPWHSLLYNLFFPFLTTLSLLFLLFSIPVHLLIPPLGIILHRFNSYFTETILKITDSPPLPLKTWYIEEMSSLTLTVSLTLLLGIAIAYRCKE